MSKEEYINEALAEYWKDMQLGITATIVRLAFTAGFMAGENYSLEFALKEQEKLIDYLKKL